MNDPIFLDDSATEEDYILEQEEVIREANDFMDDHFIMQFVGE
jgi:hypothetical protein